VRAALTRNRARLCRLKKTPLGQPSVAEDPALAAGHLGLEEGEQASDLLVCRRRQRMKDLGGRGQRRSEHAIVHSQPTEAPRRRPPLRSTQ